MTAREWELYNYDDTLSQQVARILNLQLEFQMLLQKSRNEVRLAMHKEMESYSDFGAADTAAYEVLDYFLDEIFGK